METFANCKMKIDPAKHVNYAYGMVLGVDDFTQEFGYLSGRDQWMVRDLAGYGTVCGLKVSVEDSSDGPKIHVTPGTAINQQGQMIHLKRDQCALLNKWLEDEQNDKKLKEITATSPPTSEITVYVVLSHKECLTDERPIPGEPCRSEKDLMAPSRIADHYGLELTFDPPNQCEELAIRDFVRGLREQVTISTDGISSLDQLKEFIKWVSESVKTTSPSDKCPSIEFTIDSPPVFSHIHPSVALDYLRAAFRIWVTELRKQVRHNYLGGWCGCGGDVGNKAGIGQEDRILLAELCISLVDGHAGNIETNEEDRPFIISLRTLQEWLLCNATSESCISGGTTDHGALSGLGDDDHLQYHTDTRGDARYSKLDHGHSLGALTDVNTPMPADGEVLTHAAGKWIAAAPVVGITDHSALQGLADDDHQQYLLINGTRPMSGNLNMNNNQVTGLPQGINNGDAVRFEQAVKNEDAASGDLAGKYPAPIVAKLQNKPVSDTAPQNGDFLSWNGVEWAPKKSPTDEGRFVIAASREIPYAIVAAGRFDGKGNNQGEVYNGLRVTSPEPGIYVLWFKGYSSENLAKLVYIVKGTVFHSNNKPAPRGTFEVIDFSSKGVVVSVFSSKGEPDVEALGFMVEISAYGKL